MSRSLSFTDRPSLVRPSLVRPSGGEDLRAKAPIKMKTFLGRLSLSLSLSLFLLLQLSVGGRAEIPEATITGDNNEWPKDGEMFAAGE